MALVLPFPGNNTSTGSQGDLDVNPSSVICCASFSKLLTFSELFFLICKEDEMQIGA